MDVRTQGPDIRSYGISLTAEESLAELSELARGAGAEVVGATLQVRDRLSPSALLGSGKLRELKAWAAAERCEFVLLDHDLTATQQRNLENALECRVLDRTQLILDIFAKHARSHAGRLQVELAQLEYLLPRLAGRGSAMSRLGGGIGTRGPGETQLETDRRRIRKRIAKLTADLKKVRLTRRLQRSRRMSVPLPTVALCGYTNAGKSTLFNALTEANVEEADRMFATLDPTIRKLRLPSGRSALLSDTVGFIRNLPPTLLEAFRATLEEVTEASLILHVVDASAEHAGMHRKEVDRVLAALGAGTKPQVLAFNKADLLPGGAQGAAKRHPAWNQMSRAIHVSARERVGLDSLLAAVDQLLEVNAVICKRFLVPYADGSALTLLYEQGRVLERENDADAVAVTAELSPSLARRLDRYAVGA